MGGEITLQDALERVESSAVKERGEGLADLKHVLTHVLRNNRGFDRLSDASFHRIFETLFGVTVSDQSAYLKAKTPTTRSVAEKRLSLCASNLRLALDYGVRHIKQKTVRSIVNHIIETLRFSHGAFCEPIALDYAKCLRALLNYQPHAEHLSKDDRERIATFCCDCITPAESESADHETGPGAEITSKAGTSNGLSYRSSRSTFKDSAADSQGGRRSLAKQIADEMVSCLSFLTAPPNAAPGRKASDLISVLIRVLQTSKIGRGSHQDAFAAINHILAWIRTEDVELTRRNASALIRLIRNYWSIKSSSKDIALSALRAQLLISWIYLRPYIFCVADRAENLTLRSELAGLLDVIKNEYGNRDEREQLRIDDLRLDFSDSTSSTDRICTAIFDLQCRRPGAEANWTVVNMMATLCNALSDRLADEISSDEGDDDDRPRKRQKLNNEFEDTITSSVNGPDKTRIGALQTLALLAQQTHIGTGQLVKAIDKICTSYGGDNPTVSSWAMLTLASFASQLQSNAPSLSSRWFTVWQIATRAMNNASTCRSACHLIRILLEVKLVPQQTVSEFVRTIVSSMDLNGPSVFADSVAHLLVLIVTTSQQTNPASSAGTAESALSWVFRNFWPSKFSDREYTSQHAIFEPRDVVEIISCCLAQSAHNIRLTQYPVWEPVGQTWSECSEQQDLIQYLLLLPNRPTVTHERIRVAHQLSTLSSQPRFTCEALVLSHLTSEIYRTQEEWSQLLREKPRGIGLDALTFSCKSCVSAACIAFCTSFRDSRRQNQLQRQLKDLLRTLEEFIRSPNCPQDEIDAMLSIFSTACHGLSVSEPRTKTPQCELHICQIIAKGMAARREYRELNGLDGDDEMEMDEAQESQDSRIGAQSTGKYDIKTENMARFSNLSLEANVTTYATVIMAQNDHATSPNAGSSTQVIDYLLSLPDALMLLSRSVVSSLSYLEVEIHTADCYRLLNHCAKKLFDSYTYNRSEVALSAILEIMSSFAPALTTGGSELYDLGLDMYEWYTSVALGRGVLSPSVQKRVANLLLQLCHIDTDYGRDDTNNIPSARTSLFKLVELGTVTVQFYLANRVSTIFGLFVLSNHSAMFDDLQKSLPLDADFIEGIAMRLLFLAKLASAWHSLLRQCIYYIFETAGRVKNSTEHAARSVMDLAKSLEFESPRKLFKLFAPQLLHTWLESQPVTSLPFAIFQYESLQMLMEQNENELVAQLLVRGNEEGLQFVTETLQADTKALTTRCFAKCEAYCIAWDISHSAESNEAKCETRLRTLLGTKEEYKILVTTEFAATMGHFYLSLQQEDVHDKWLEKKTQYASAAKALEEMKAYSHSERALPSSQQPCFKAKYMFEEIGRLCRRAGHDPIKLWDSATFTTAARLLLDSIEDALGPLHTCLVIRKLRLLIAMAGSVPFSGFPLEMLVHTLRPFLADSQCADDVMGVLQYLFHHGQTYLQENVRFLYGTVILMILQMLKHTGSKLESTTQESQHQATAQRMRKFQAWLVEYLQKCQRAGNSADPNTSISVTNALRVMNLPGNARRDSPQSTLLLFLLDDNESIRRLISNTDREEALVLLSDKFELPNNASEDCLGLDRDCSRFADPLWRSVKVHGLSEAFIEWAASVLGRVYASTGSRPRSASDIERKRVSNISKQHRGVDRSQATISQRLADLLFSRNRAAASLADYTLRNVLRSFNNSEEAIMFQQMLPDSIVPSVTDGSHGYNPFHVMDSSLSRLSIQPLHKLLEPSSDTSLEVWAQSVSVALCLSASETAIFPALTVALQNSRVLALELLPCILHILLVKEFDGGLVIRRELSRSVAAHLTGNSDILCRKQQYLIDLILYLREVPLPGERTLADRLRWLEIDWLVASEAGTRCGMPTAALLFAEFASSTSPTQSGRRGSTRVSLSQLQMTQASQELLLTIFRNLEEPDSFYGVEQSASLDSVLGRLDYEADGYRSLMFRSAQTDTHLRQSHQLTQMDNSGIIRSLSMLNLDSLTFALLSAGFGPVSSSNELLNTARRLQQWDVLIPQEAMGLAPNAFGAFQELSRASDRSVMQSKLQSILLRHMQPMTSHERPKRPSHEWFGVLASLTEIGEAVNSGQAEAIQSTWSRMQERQSWMALGRYSDFQMILSNRHTLFSVLAQNQSLLKITGFGAKDCRAIEVESLLSASRLARQHGQLQEALVAANQCSILIRDGKESILQAEVAAKVETASVLWDLGEVTPSVKMLQDAQAMSESAKQDVPVGRSGLLAQLAHQLAEARLEKPDDIMTKYLKPAINQLQGREDGQEAGKVFHEFATFCDKQLQNPGNVEDFNRIAKLRDRKLKDVEELDRLSKSTRKSATEKDAYERDRGKAKQWYQIDDTDYQRLKRSRETFIEQSLQNYLRALHASDEHDISILRFFALWLENSDVAIANATVSKYLPRVPSWKFVVLMNQLMSRLEQDGSLFQEVLKTLLTRMCSEHPHHSLHHLFALTRPPLKEDQAGLSRYNVATDIRKALRSDSKSRELLEHVFRANKIYVELAAQKIEDIKPGSKVTAKDIPLAATLVRTIPTLQVPPATMSIPLQPSCNYDNVPYISRISSTINIMSGNSKPKRVMAYVSNGEAHYQLLKAGEDLRQDAIMEQVFGEVSKMLQNHKSTRQRNLQVRTYKVIPLSTQDGMIEFVPNSTSFQAFLVPAHERYYPQDIKNSDARDIISHASRQPVDAKIKEFRKVCDKLHPVMRHFFFERYQDPDEWFEKRTAYTRTTATISILGYVLGLGDRHCQNIMLDEKTGEVVHIDLGIAFEAGRVLPVPELVPFRLTRDVIDGMGVTKTEGVFRRCCEFTMDALREDKDSIMTLLNVLRYDPLYTWTISPLRAKRMQEESGRRNAGDADATEGSSKKREQEAGEADRALSIVEKKLSKTLSTAATVNELIQQATDVRNLATLFSGWSAYL